MVCDADVIPYPLSVVRSARPSIPEWLSEDCVVLCCVVWCGVLCCLFVTFSLSVLCESCFVCSGVLGGVGQAVVD